MSNLIDTTYPEPVLDAARPAPSGPARSPARAISPDLLRESAGQPLAAILVTSVTAHLLVVGLLGFGLGGDAPVRPPPAPVIPPTTVEEKVDLQAAPPEEPAPIAQSLPDDAPPVPTAPAVADIDLPPLPALSEVTAVSLKVPVAFAIPVKGPVHLTNDPGRATGAVGGRAGGPISLDADGQLGKNLLLPTLTYPAAAIQRRITGSVDIAFRAESNGGGISGAKVWRSSGFSELDLAALQNLRQGRWLGVSGYYVKTYVFVLN